MEESQPENQIVISPKSISSEQKSSSLTSSLDQSNITSSSEDDDMSEGEIEMMRNRKAIRK